MTPWTLPEPDLALKAVPSLPDMGLGGDDTPAGREFADPLAMREQIYHKSLLAVQNFQPLENKQHTLRLRDVRYVDPPAYKRKKEKDAILTNKSLSRRLGGTWELTDNLTGQVIDQKHATIARIPYVTSRGTIIQNGIETAMGHQDRLKSGIFNVRQRNGDLESHVNVMPGQGVSSNIVMDPKKGTFHFRLGQANIPFYPILKMLGAKDEEISQVWGRDLLNRNQRMPGDAPMKRLYQKLARKQDPNATEADQQREIINAFAKMQLDPDVTERTLGSAFKSVDAKTLLAATQRLLAINRGEAEPDDRDHMAYQAVLGPEDLIAERFSRDRKPLLPLLWKATQKKSLAHMPSAALDRLLAPVLQGSSLLNILEEVNPAELLDQQQRITRLGPGGLSNPDAVPESARNVHSSQLGLIDLVRTPERGAVGIDSRVASNARKGEDGKIYTQIRDIKTGKMVWKTPQELSKLVFAFPQEIALAKKYGHEHVQAMKDGQQEYVPLSEVDYELPYHEKSFGGLANMIPMKSGIKGQRISMGARFLAQALELEKAEAPLVQSGIPDQDDRSYEQHYGKWMGAVHAKGPGRVLSVDPDEIVVQYADGTKEEHELYNNFPLNRKSLLHNTPLVKPGDTVDKDSILAKSNFTDDKGTAALGQNVRIAFMTSPARDGAANYEDAYVVSESYAKKSTSGQAYQHAMDWDDNIKRGKGAFIGLFGSKFPRAVYDKLDNEGIIKPGQTVEYGEPLVLVAQERERRQNQVSRSKSGAFADRSLLWEHHAPGIITDVAKTDKGVNVIVRATNATVVGDKLASRYGSKGVVSKILPDDRMPQGEDGKPLDILVNQTGTISRGNPGFAAEVLLGKIAALTGRPYKLKDFSDIEDLRGYVAEELKKHGLKSDETITDPISGRQMPGILAGTSYFMKLHHVAESKSQGRGLGSYTATGQPAKTGGNVGSAKRWSPMDINAALAAGATAVNRDMSLVKGQANPEYWSKVMAGERPNTPDVPEVNRKFIDELKGAGINVVRDGQNRQHLMPILNADIDKLAGDRELQNADTVDWEDQMRPIAGGLFDEKIFGDGSRWAKISLPEPMPSPVMEEPIRRLLGLTQPKFLSILSGREELLGKTGPQAIQHALERIKVPEMIEKARLDIKNYRGSNRDAAIKRLMYLKGAEAKGIHPKDWILDKVPVTPPRHRQVARLGSSGSTLIPDANLLYKELMDSKETFQELQKHVDDLGDERLGIYNSFKAVTGLGDPTQPKNIERGLKGFLAKIFGRNPKNSAMQYQLLGGSTDLVGRGTITPNPDLDMDQVAIPEDRAWEIYKPFVIRNLVKAGVPRMRAAELATKRDGQAKHALLDEMSRRPVLINRAPVLHRWGVLAAWPRLTKSSTLEISPLITEPLGGDFDGDQMNYSVPASEEAISDAIEKLMPSKNLTAASDFKKPMFAPRQEFLAGLWLASSRIKQGPVVHFKTEEEALEARAQGKLDVDTRISIG